jgi:hypothetical protein
MNHYLQLHSPCSILAKQASSLQQTDPYIFWQQ